MSAPDFELLFTEGTMAALGPGPRPGVLSSAEAIARADAVTDAAGVGERAQTCFRALVLHWNDHDDLAHGLVQDLAGSDAAFVHGIIHRREPDYSNARYWFHRVGAHPAFGPLTDAVKPAAAKVPGLAGSLLPNGRWDGFAFIDAVARSLKRGDPGEVACLQGIQRAEFIALARHLLRG